MHRRLALALLLLWLPAALPACVAVGTDDDEAAREAPSEPGPLDEDDGRAAFLTLIGNDTLAVEWMEFEDRWVDARALVRGPRTTFGRYYLEFDEDGEVVAYTAEAWAGTDDQGPLLRSQRLERTEDGAELVVTERGEERRTALETAPGSVPFIDMLHWPFEASMRWFVEERGNLPDAVPVFSARGVQDFELERNADGTWQLIHPSRGPSTLVVGQEGQIQQLDGTGSTRAYDLRRLPYEALDPAQLAAQFANRPMGELSGRGRIDAEVAGVHFTGHYGEPRKRGREIFGELVAYDEWWRTGANEATHLSFDRDIVIDGERIPAGDYTLSSIPREDGGTLIINRQTGQGGQSYDESLDQARVEMRRSTLDHVVEAFEIRAVETEDGGRLELRWDETVYWVPFRAAGG